MLKCRDSQVMLAKSFLKPFWYVTLLPMINQQAALKRCLRDLQLAMGANQFSYDIKVKLEHFCDVVKNAPAVIPTALNNCGINHGISTNYIDPDDELNDNDVYGLHLSHSELQNRAHLGNAQ